MLNITERAAAAKEHAKTLQYIADVGAGWPIG
jgi:hypothetical protein